MVQTFDVNLPRCRRFTSGALCALFLAWTTGGCIFGVDTSVEESPDTGPVDSVDGRDAVDGATDGFGPDAGECTYLGTSEGICLFGRDVSDGGDTSFSTGDAGLDENGCAPPVSYQPDEDNCDGKDNDCDSVTDEGCSCDALGRSEGVCRNGRVSELDGTCEPPDSYSNDEDTCDGKDNDCDGVTDETCFCLFKGNRTGVCENGVRQEDGTCKKPDTYVSPETDAHCDGKDNDCDGMRDEECTCTNGDTRPCYSGPEGTAGTGVCQKGELECVDESWTDDCQGETTPASQEDCNGKDDDCDGTTDEGCTCDYDGISKGICSKGELGSGGNCKQPAGFENDETSCDGKDNDCDGTTDENCPCDFDGTSEGVCSNGTVDASNGECTAPDDYEDPESSCDSKDNDCDGSTDDSDSDLTCSCTSGTTESCYTGPSGTKGVGICEAGTRDCQSDNTWGSCTDETTPSSEGSGSNCDGMDNDCDGYTDEGCTCTYTTRSEGVCSGQTRDSTGTCPEPKDFEDPESTCSDALDNDCDGNTDCADGDCNGESCGTGSGAECRGGDCTELNCTDGVDNDNNEGTDCADPDCDQKQCGSGSGAKCISRDCKELDCGDSTDNDNDGQTDCGDSDCDGVECDGSGTTCSSSGSNCLETNCSDGVDNDSDGDTDCGDADCSQCGSGTTCSGATCIEVNCSDGMDNDGDGNTDCGDSDCAGESCGTGSGAICRNSRCAEIDCTDTNDNDLDGDVDDDDTQDCNQAGLEWCVNDNQCAVENCVSGTCAQTIVATSATYSDGALGGASGADTKCNDVAGRSRPGTWKAVVSTSNDDASDRLNVSTEVYNTNGTRVATGASDLWDGSIDAPVEYDETGSSISGDVWTGTTSGGDVAKCTINTSTGVETIDCVCEDWSSSGSLDQGTVGKSTQTNGGWLETSSRACNQSGFRLYCIDGQ